MLYQRAEKGAFLFLGGEEGVTPPTPSPAEIPPRGLTGGRGIISDPEKNARKTAAGSGKITLFYSMKNRKHRRHKGKQDNILFCNYSQMYSFANS